jgi:hypothetical protein
LINSADENEFNIVSAPEAAGACRIACSSLFGTGAFSRLAQRRSESTEADEFFQSLRVRKFQVLTQQCPVHVTHVNFHDWITIRFGFHRQFKLSGSPLRVNRPPFSTDLFEIAHGNL